MLLRAVASAGGFNKMYCLQLPTSPLAVVCPFKMSRRPEQLALPEPPTWGGRRDRAGRKRRPGRRPSVAHRTRSAHAPENPLLITLRARSAVRCLRSARVFSAVHSILATASHDSFRIVHFSVQDDHVHLLVEADSRGTLSRGMHILASRLARRVNRILGRTGALWDSRFHSRALTAPREVRSAILYVLMNRKKHRRPLTLSEIVDPCSSAVWFDGWRNSPEVTTDGPPPIRKAQTWLLRLGWQRHGPIDFHEAPSASRRSVKDRR
jgi:REP element-mobilizing transposase RayT